MTKSAFGILPRSKIIPLEVEGIKKALQYIIQLSKKKIKITPEIIQDIHRFWLCSWFGRRDVKIKDFGKLYP